MKTLMNTPRSSVLTRSLRILVVGLAPLLSACPSPNLNMPPGSKDAGAFSAKVVPVVPALTEAETKLVIQAKFSPNKADRVIALDQLKGNPAALVEVASAADFADTRRMSVQMIGADTKALNDIILHGRCRDSRTLALNVQAAHMDEVSNITYPCPVFALAAGEQRQKAKVRMATLLENTPIVSRPPGMTIDSFTNFCSALFSTDSAKRQNSVSNLKRVEFIGSLEEIGVHSEYANTRKSASDALDELGHPMTREADPAHDISRFNKCVDGTPKQSSDEPHKKGRLRRAWDVLRGR